MNRTLLIVVFLNTLLLFPICLNAQKNKSENNENTAILLKQKYTESEAAIIYKDIAVNFTLNNQEVSVVETTDSKIMSLRIENELKRSIYYDINSKVSEDYIETERHKALPFVPVCGNYEKDDIFHSDNKLCVYPLIFKKLGEIQHFGYTLTKNDIRYFTSVYFQSDLPVLTSKIIFNVPQWLDVELKEINFNGYSIQKTVKNESPKVTTYEYTATNLDEFKEEPLSFGISHTYPHILIVAKSFKNSEGKKEKIISTINDLHDWYNKLIVQLKNDNTSFKPTVDKLIAQTPNDLDKIKTLFYWVQDNIRYIAFENGIAGYKPAEPADVFKRKYGDCKGMANLTKWMLKTAGFDARLVWIGTNSIPYNYSIPSLAINNHMICCVILNKKRYYLDATEKYIGFNTYAERIQGRIAMVEDGKSYFLDTIPVFNKDQNLSTKQFDLTISNNSLSGKCTQNYQGESHQQVLYFLNNLKKEKQKDFKELLISSEDKNITVNNVTSSDITNKENPYQINGEVIINNKISAFDNDLYIDLDFYKDFKNQKIKDSRKSDLFFDEKKYTKMIVNLDIPSGYKIKYVPAPLEIKENQFGVTIKYVTKNNRISYERIITIDNGLIPKSDIEKWNKAIKALSEKYNDNVILTRN